MSKLNSNTVLVKPGTLDVVSLSAGDEVPEWASELVGEHLIEGEASPAAEAQADPEKADVPDESWTLEELRDYAKSHDVDLHGATKKADILDAIKG